MVMHEKIRFTSALTTNTIYENCKSSMPQKFTLIIIITYRSESVIFINAFII